MNKFDIQEAIENGFDPTAPRNRSVKCRCGFIGNSLTANIQHCQNINYEYVWVAMTMRSERRRLGLVQGDLGSQGWISDKEKGDTSINLSTLVRLRSRGFDINRIVPPANVRSSKDPEFVKIVDDLLEHRRVHYG